jgi:hypothetical protein
MMTKMILAVLALCSAGAAMADGIVGHYTVNGTNLDGSRYAGEAQITATSDVTCDIAWNTNGTISDGICMRDGNAFTAGYVLNGKVGLVIYLIQADGSLRGTWTVDGVNAVGTETLTPD